MRVYTFPAGERHAGSTRQLTAPAVPRRLARSQRRRLRRAAGRRHKARELFVQYGLIEDTPLRPGQAVDGVPAHFHKYRHHPALLPKPGQGEDPWQLRARGLHELLSGEQFAKALFHIIKHRGFQSSRKAGFQLDKHIEAAGAQKDDQKAAEEGKMKQGVLALAKRLRASRYETIGEMLALDAEYAQGKRNRPRQYSHTVLRELLVEEIKLLFERQRQQGSQFASPEFEQGILDCLTYVKPPQTAALLESLVGQCTYYPDLPRSPQNTWSAERFILLCKANNVSYWLGTEKKMLTPEQRQAVIAAAYEHPAMTFKHVRAAAGLDPEARFTAVNYGGRRRRASEPEGAATRPSKDPETMRFIRLTGYHTLRSACTLGGVWERVQGDAALQDTLAEGLFYHKNEGDFRDTLRARGVAEDVIEAAAGVLPEGFSGTRPFSARAIAEMLPHLEAGQSEYEATKSAGLTPSGTLPKRADGKLLPGHFPSSVLINPAVHRALSRCRKLVNAIVTRYGPPLEVHIEMARDLGRGMEARSEIEMEQRLREKENLDRAGKIRDLGADPETSQNSLKYALREEQLCHCPYCARPIDLEEMLTVPDYTEIDHIIPRCLSLDDSRANKVVVHNGCNRDKGALLARVYVEQHQPQALARYLDWAQSLARSNPGKMRRLLKNTFDEEEQGRWQARYLNDTRTITKTLAAVLQQNLNFAEGASAAPVRCFSGSVVALARRHWGLPFKDRKGDAHHAVDAVVVAALSSAELPRLTRYLRVVETRKAEVDTETGDVLEWRPGTNKKPRLNPLWPGLRERVRELLDEAEQPPLEGPIERVFICRQPERRMSGPMHADTIRPLELKGAREGVQVREGFAENAGGSLLRLDVFRAKRGYRLVPVYVADYLRGVLPEGDGEFQFSIHTGELVRVQHGRGNVVGYCVSANPPAHRLKLRPWTGDNTRRVEEKCVVTASLIEKFDVTLLGEVHRVRHEKRQALKPPEKRHGVANDSDHQPGTAPD